MTIKRALISVSDKSELAPLVQALHEKNVEIISTGGTAKIIEGLKVPVTPIEKITGNPECLDGRVKTLSFKVEAGILFQRQNEKHCQQTIDLDILPIDLVVVNLYPFEEVSKKTADLSTLIENIDIGGPTMLRSAAKNYEDVTVLNSPTQYASFLNEFKENGETSLDFRKKCALEVFRSTADYDSYITQTLVDQLQPQSTLRYGENPHQKAFLLPTNRKESLLNGEKLQGKEFSYNNYLDMNAAWELISELNLVFPEKVSTTVVKHLGPCGLSTTKNAQSALELAWKGDSTSAFGSIVATNSTIDKEQAEFLIQNFVEIVMAPKFSDEAKTLFEKKKNLRLFQIKPFQTLDIWETRNLMGAQLVQRKDFVFSKDFKTVTQKKFSQNHTQMIPFGNIAVKHLKSNAIAIVSSDKDGSFWLTGSGAGQPNRLDSFQLAAKKFYDLARFEADFIADSILTSDAFFPFDDIVKLCTEIDIHHIVQPGGSIRDEEVIKTCDELGLSMTLTGMRHFKH